MSLIPEIRPVKLFVNVLKVEPLEERLVHQFGPVDLRSSVAPIAGTIHRVFLSFERLVQSDSLADFIQHAASIEKEYPTPLDVGFLDNRRVVVALKKNAAHRSDLGNNIFGEEVIQFKSGEIHFLPWTEAVFQS